MIIKISNLPVGVHAFNFEETAEQLQLGEPFVDNLILDCKVDKSQHQIVVACNLTISAQLICDRCNNEFIKALHSDFTLLYMYDRDNIDQNDVNVKFISPTQDKINLTEDVLDYAKLSVPMKKLCNENCKGLCMKCGANLNQVECNCADDDVVPGWEPLQKLKDKLN